MADDGSGDVPGEWDITDEEIDSWFEELEAVDQAAADYLAERVDGLGDEVGEEDARWLDALAETIAPDDEPDEDRELDDLEIETMSAVAALQHADWLGLALGVVDRGPGSALDPEAVLADVNALEEIEGEIDDPEGFLEVLAAALSHLTPQWRELGVLDADDRTTARGVWGLPRALYRLWNAA
ncbi:hypothetical protein E8D34_14640 [Nocardioides sp. GY 10113]|uniref:hypothetical protein n=1 Tax=Nocardioides sp. GY 10113 TaxID=2569761 RepID=UPI0010A83DE9|nr:hypothetical protein [Nocardioides sp. GY 10113]TIC79742.1 hypothetical protein E8D34_19740 [Nocardioides sp. GY 10113]TIC84930.1 hypothetical protein E8D34_14640 [Nocardioides sp. GY 10113]